MQNTFFDTLNTGAAPLAERMRAQVMNEFIGQRHVVGENSLCGAAYARTNWEAASLYPGCGKTTLAHIIANAPNVPLKS
ncbi:MAG: hypothetical protein ACLU1U_04225 [Lachnospiraceae bacterium]